MKFKQRAVMIRRVESVERSEARKSRKLKKKMRNIVSLKVRSGNTNRKNCWPKGKIAAN